MKRFISIRDFGDQYGPKRTQTYFLITTGTILAVKIGPRTMIDVESAEQWAASLPRFKSAASKHTDIAEDAGRALSRSRRAAP